MGGTGALALAAYGVTDPHAARAMVWLRVRRPG